MANILTLCRIVCGITLLFFPPFSPMFYALYCLAGFTDMLDGAVARRTGAACKAGERLDTIADLIFAVACLIKLLPALNLPTPFLIWIALIAVIKVVNIISGFITERRFAALHTVMNRLTGILLFILPFTINFIDLKISLAAVCAVASFAAIQEGHFIRTGRTPRE